MAKKFYEVQSHIILTGHIMESMLTVVGNHVWTRLILLQKSGCSRRGTAGAIFEAVFCHPLDRAGDLRSTLLTLATLTQRTKGRTGVAGRPTWQACGGFAQSPPA
jgi:hypothetical protein